MTVDISRVFKANVKAIRVSLNDSTEIKSDALNEQLLGRKINTKQEKKNADSEARKIASQVVREAKHIIQNVSILKNFLLENKKAYIQPNNLLTESDDSIQYDWQAYEDQAEGIIKRTADSNRSLKERTLSNDIFTAQYREHLENIFYLLDKYLKEVCNIYSEQKAIRVKRILDRKNFSQLCSAELKENSNRANRNKNFLLTEELTSTSKKTNEDNRVDLIGHGSNQLSEQELLMFESENDLIYDDLVSQSQEIKQIETEVIEVSRLTQIFAENIVSQLSTAGSIHKSAVEANTNIIAGNEDIKEAMKKNAALRLWILFIIVVLAFTLLFLDWYND